MTAELSCVSPANTAPHPAPCGPHRRRALLTAAAALSVHPVLLRAQPVEKLRVIGYLTPSAQPQLRDEVFKQNMGELGWVEGKNLRVETRRADNDMTRLAALADELVNLKVELIVALSTPAVAAAKKATQTIPIVSISADPEGSGFITSLARPGGNITGISMMIPVLAGKRLELLREISPALKQVAFLAYGGDPAHKIFLAEAETAAKALGMQLQPHIVNAPLNLETTFAAIKKQGAGALLVQTLFINTLGLGKQIAALSLKHRLMAAADGDNFVEQGGLLNYGPDPQLTYRRIAYFVDRVLRGTAPANLPVELPQHFLVAVNLATAKQLGVRVPQSVMVRATRVIE